MNMIKNMKLLRSIVNSQDRKKYYSTNTSRIINTYRCLDHNEYCTKICTKCNMDLCQKCHKNFHYNHQVISYDEINPSNSEIANLQKQINKYLDLINILRKNINIWYNELKNKLYDFEISLKNNEILNSKDFINNYSKNKICFNTIFKFRKIYYNIMEENNINNKKKFSLINQYENNYIKFPSYSDYYEINNLVQNLTNSENFRKRGELIISYLSRIPYIENSNYNMNYSFELNNNNDSSSQQGFIFNKYLSKNNFKNSEELCNQSTGQKYSTEDFKTNSERRLFDSKINRFKNILNKTKIPEFNLNSTNFKDNSNPFIKTFNYEEKKNFNITDFSKYLNKIGLFNMNENDLHKENSSQDLLNKSSYSVKSSKYIPGMKNLSLYNFDEKKTNDLSRNKTNFYNLFHSNEIGNIYMKSEANESQVNNNLSFIPMKPLYSIKNPQTKTYVHKKFKINNNINRINLKEETSKEAKNIDKINDNKKNNIIKFQKKLIIINKSNKQNKHNNNENLKTEERKISQNNNENKDINEINDNSKLLNQKMTRTKQINDDIIINDHETKDKIFNSPIKTELFQNAIISETKNNKINDYDKDNDESKINSTDKKNLLHIIYSPSTNKNQSTIKKNKNNASNNNINYQTYKISNSTNMNINIPNIVKTYKNSSFFVDPKKELCIGLELGNSDCKLGIVNQNTSEIQLVCFDDDKYSIPTLVSFSKYKKEIKIGYEAQKDIINNPSQTIFNIFKYFGVKYNDVKCRNELYPFKIYYTNDEENRPYIKIDFGPQKDKIFYFESIINIFLEKMFELIFNKVNLENTYNNTEEKLKNEEQTEYNNIITLNIVLVLTVPNHFSFSQRKIIENIIQNQIFPSINNSEFKVYGHYRINLVKLGIENASSIGSLCLLKNYDINPKERDLLILNVDGGSVNISITSSKNENEKIFYKVKALKGLQKGEVDLIDDFMYEILNKFEKNIKKEILESPLALVKFRKICQKIRDNLIIKKNDSFNIVEILENYDGKIEITRDDYENSINIMFNNIKNLILETMRDANISEKEINEVIFIGQICKEKKFHEIVEILFISSIYEELIYSNYLDAEKDYYNVGGAAYHALNYINNNNIYSFEDVCPFDIGIINYLGELNLIINKGETIPISKEKILKIKNENSLKLYEKLGNNKNRLIGTIELDNESKNDIENILKYGYKEIKIKYEVNDKIELSISIFNFNEGKYEKKKLDFLLI